MELQTTGMGRKGAEKTQSLHLSGKDDEPMSDGTSPYLECRSRDSNPDGCNTH